MTIPDADDWRETIRGRPADVANRAHADAERFRPIVDQIQALRAQIRAELKAHPHGAFSAVLDEAEAPLEDIETALSMALEGWDGAMEWRN